MTNTGSANSTGQVGRRDGPPVIDCGSGGAPRPDQAGAGTGQQPRLANDRGASMVLVALSLVWIVGIAALVIDIGEGWLTRQSLIPATDAAALAAAQDMIAQPWNIHGACAIAREYVAANAAEATMTGCNVVSTASGGWVTVDASDQLDPIFADAVDAAGNGPTDVISSSTVAWGPPLTVSGLRPFGLCYDGSSELKQLLDNPPTSRTWVRIEYTKDDPSACGGPSALGNFATIDFDGGTPTYEIRDWMLNGYPNHLGFDPLDITDCSGNAVCYDRPYASSDIRTEIAALHNSGTYVNFAVFNYADIDHVHLVGLLRARFYAYQLDGSPGTWWIELKVEPGLVAGTCCGPAGLRTGTSAIAICAVDPDPSGSGCEGVGGQ